MQWGQNRGVTLLFIYTLEEHGYRVSFFDGKALMWPKGNTIEDAVVNSS